MKYTYIYAMAFSLLSLNAMAQETYENTKLTGNDLSGTARYVGMGGAMDAIGADLSVISTNPAGVSMLRSSVIAISAGVRSQSDAISFNGTSKTHPTFEQIGANYVWRNSNTSRLGVAFNYRNKYDFNHLLSASGTLGDGTQNKLSYMKAIGGTLDTGISDFNLEERNGVIRGTSPFTSQLDNLYYNNFLVGAGNQLHFYEGTSYLMNRKNQGYIGEYSFNINGTSNERFYWGITFGINDVHYEGNSVYTEQLIDSNNTPAGTAIVTDRRLITGTGFDVKAGVIIRPFANSPFRFGLSISTPTWYDLTTSNYTTLSHLEATNSGRKDNQSTASYSYKVFTPWKFGVSLGHTFGTTLALGASYEYADYGSTDTRVIDPGAVYDYYTDTYENTSSSDRAMNAHTERTLKGVSTFKLGSELKLNTNLSARAGYNYVSPMFNKNAYKDGIINSYGSNYSSATDYINWGATNRLTLGLGYTAKKISVDLAYVYSATNGDFYPFMGGTVDEYTGRDAGGRLMGQTHSMTPMGVKVSDKSSKLLVTLGYRF